MELVDYIEKDTNPYFYNRFENMHTEEEFELMLKDGEWTLKSEKSKLYLSKDGIIDALNENKIDLTKIHVALHETASNKAMYHHMRYEEGIKVLGQEAVDKHIKGWAEFTKSLKEAIEGVTGEESKEKQQQSKPKFQLLDGDKEE